MFLRSFALGDCVVKLSRARDLTPKERMQRVTLVLSALLLCLREYRIQNIVVQRIYRQLDSHTALASRSLPVSVFLSACLFAGVNHTEPIEVPWRFSLSLSLSHHSPPRRFHADLAIPVRFDRLLRGFSFFLSFHPFFDASTMQLQLIESESRDRKSGARESERFEATTG